MLNMIPNDAECGSPVRRTPLWVYTICGLTIGWAVGGLFSIIEGFGYHPFILAGAAAGAIFGAVMATILAPQPTDSQNPFDNQEPVELEDIEPEETP